MRACGANGEAVKPSRERAISVLNVCALAHFGNLRSAPVDNTKDTLLVLCLALFILPGGVCSRLHIAQHV